MSDRKIVSLDLEGLTGSIDKVAIVDAGGYLAQILARKVRELKVFSEVISPETPLADYAAHGYKAILVIGGASDLSPESVPYPAGFWDQDLPILAIGDPALVMARHVDPSARFEDEVSETEKEQEFTDRELAGRKIMAHFSSELECFAGDDGQAEVIVRAFRPLQLEQDSPWEVLGVTSDTLVDRGRGEGSSIPVVAFRDEAKQRYGVSFHPELSEAKPMRLFLKEFLVEIAGVTPEWELETYVDATVQKIREVVGDKRAVCAFSGGVDSAVAALLVHRAIGQQLSCIYVDTGLMRLHETEEVKQVFAENYKMNIKIVDASDRFLGRLKGVTDPERKRKIIGEEFIRVFEDESKSLGDVDYLVQGTIYPDVIESGFKGQAMVKSHHNVGGLPEDIGFTGIIEPLRDLFKLEVRRVGLYLGLPEKLVWRQPFPGPGLSVRCLGEVTRERLDVLRQADAIFREEIFEANLHRDIQQYFAVLSNVHSVGTRNNERTYEETCVLRAVKTVDFMTAHWVTLPYELLNRVAERIIREVPGINRVAYDITSKPPATIEWE